MRHVLKKCNDIKKHVKFTRFSRKKILKFSYVSDIRHRHGAICEVFVIFWPTVFQNKGVTKA